MTPAGQLSIAPTIAPTSGTGSDLHDMEQGFQFGDITNGSEPENWISKLIQQAAMGVAVALAVKVIMGKVKF